MSKWLTRIFGVLVLAFILFWLILNPAQSSAAVRTFFEAVAGAWHQIVAFFTGLG